MGKALDNKELVFVGEYLIDLDPKRAALAAGYSKTVASTKAYQWVSNGKVKPHVFVAIQNAMDKRSTRTEITADRVLQEIARLAFANLQDFYNENGSLKEIKDLPREVAAALSSTKINLTEACAVQEIKLHDKKGSLELLGKHLKLFTDKLEVSGELTLADKLKAARERAAGARND